MQNRLLFSAVHLNSHVFTVLHSCKVIKLYVRHLFFYFINFFICFNLRSWKDIKDISAYYWNKRQPTKTAKINFQNSWFKSGSRLRSKKVRKHSYRELKPRSNFGIGAKTFLSETYLFIYFFKISNWTEIFKN